MSSTSRLPRSTAVPLDGLRGIIAQRMMTSASSTARVSLHGEADVSRLTEARATLEAAGRRVSYEDLVLYCLAQALPRHPSLNGVVSSREILLARAVNIGVAIALGDSLIVPTLFDLAGKSLQQIATERARLVARGRSKQLTVSEMTGAGFTISNIGAHRIHHFTPLINVPQIAILGLGQVALRPWVGAEGRLAVCRTLGLSLSFDHRAVNGDPAAALLTDLIAALESFRLNDELDR